MIDGYWEYYYSNGQLMFKGNYINGKRDGYWRHYYSNGKLQSNGLYKNGRFIENKVINESKKKLFIPRKLTKDDSRYNKWNNSQPIKTIDGKEVRINQYTYDGLKNGYWEEYFDDGVLDYRGSYVNGKQDGYWEEFWGNGELYYKGSFLNGKRHGDWEIYDIDGELMHKKLYVNGVKQ